MRTFYSHVDGYYRRDPAPTPVSQAAFDHWDIQYDEVAERLNNLAALSQAQDVDQEAEPLCQRALAICEQTAGPQHPITARSLNNLVRLYHSQGRYQEAEPLCQRALAIYEQTAGPQHPITANILNNLAALSQAQGRYQEAELLYRRALAIYGLAMDSEHPDRATILLNNMANGLNNLAALYQVQGWYQEAEPLYQRALAICEQVAGSEHPLIQDIQANRQQLILKLLFERKSRSRGRFLGCLFRRFTRRKYDFVHLISRVYAPIGGDITLSGQELQMVKQIRIDQIGERKRFWKQQFTERLERSAMSLKEVLDLHTTAVNEAPAWGYSPSPMAERLPNGSIKVTTYHLGGEWQTVIYYTELEVVHSLYGGWDLGEWQEVDWEARDLQLAEEVRHAALRLKDPREWQEEGFADGWNRKSE